MFLKRIICSIALACFILSFTDLPPAYSLNVQNALSGNMLSLTASFHPLMIQGMRIHPENPLKFDFIMDTGDADVDINGVAFKQESTKLIKYFLASLTVPENEMWVNLSPYEKNRIIADGLGKTELGRDMLTQDYILKQLTSSLLYPDSKTGKAFWAKIYTQAHDQLGVVKVPINALNKVWIVPDKAIVYEYGTTVYVTKTHLKVMLEEDYEALNHEKFQGATQIVPKNMTSKHVKSVLQEIIIPELTKEINEGANFANLLQIYKAMVLAVWYKENLRQTLLGKVYANKNKTMGVDAADQSFRQKIYNQYLKSFKKGVYNYIREENDPNTGARIPRKYFAGGLQGINAAMIKVIEGPLPAHLLKTVGKRVMVDSAMVETAAVFTKAGFLNHITNGEVPAHLAIRHQPNQADFIVSFPKESGVGVSWHLFSNNGDFNEKILKTSAVVKDGFRGIDSQILIEGQDGNASLTLKSINLRDIVGIRSFVFNNMNLPQMEEELKAHILQLPANEQQRIKTLMGINSFAEDFITPKVYINIQQDGSHLIHVTKTAFNNRRYQLQIRVPPGFIVDNNAGTLKIKGSGKLILNVRAMTDFKPLTKLSMDRLFNKQAQERIKEDPAFRKKAEYFSLLFHEEKLLAGSWVYLSYFGRDSLQGSALMWSALSLEAKMLIVRSILGRIAEDGTVAVSDEDFGDRNFQLHVVEAFNRLSEDERKDPNNLLKMFDVLRKSEEQRGLKYNVLDATFLFSGILKLLFKDLNDNDLEKFLNERNDRNERNILTIIRHSNRILALTDPYGKAIQALHEKYPGIDVTTLSAFKNSEFKKDDFKVGDEVRLVTAMEADHLIEPSVLDPVSRINNFINDPRSAEGIDVEFVKRFELKMKRKLSPLEIRYLLEKRYPQITPKGVATQLIGLEPDEKDFNWRDSNWGNAGGIFAADINVSLAPMAIRNIKTLVDRVYGLGNEDLDFLIAQINAHSIDQYENAWSTSIEHFKTHLSVAELREKYRTYFKLSTLDADKKQFLLNSIIGTSGAGQPITLQQFLDNENVIPIEFKDGISFINIAQGKMVMHTDEIYSLLYDDLSSKDLRRILNYLFVPYPIGLWNDDLGLFVSHAFLLSHNNINFDEIRAIFESGEYHGQNVIWSKTMGELATGLIRQLRNATEERRFDDVGLLKEKLRKVVQVDLNVGELREQEVWTWKPGKDGHMIPWPYVIEGEGGGQPSGEPQLWGLSSLLVEPEYQDALKSAIKVMCQEWKSHLRSQEIQDIFSSAAPPYHFDDGRNVINIRGINELSVLDPEILKPMMANGLLSYVSGLIKSNSNGSSIALVIAHLVEEISNEAQFLAFVDLLDAAPNAAMITNPGGIDLNPKLLHLEAKNKENSQTFTTATESTRQINSLTPIITRIRLLDSGRILDY